MKQHSQKAKITVLCFSAVVRKLTFCRTFQNRKFQSLALLYLFIESKQIRIEISLRCSSEFIQSKQIIANALRTHLLISLISESNEGAGYSLSTELENCDWCRPVCLPSSVATTPGCTAFTVTPVPVAHTFKHMNMHTHAYTHTQSTV